MPASVTNTTASSSWFARSPRPTHSLRPGTRPAGWPLEEELAMRQPPRALRSLTRRDVLRLGGGVALYLPLLEACGRAGGSTPPRARTASQAQALGTTAQRFLAFMTPNGVVPEEWFPAGGETDFTLGQILAPLEEHR